MKSIYDIVFERNFTYFISYVIEKLWTDNLLLWLLIADIMIADLFVNKLIYKKGYD